jgi:hypothetical protein
MSQECRSEVSATSNSVPPAGGPIRVFIHLAHNKNAEEWRDAKRSGRLVGFNEETPYCYGRAERMGCQIVYSRADRERLPRKIVRLAVRAVTGFDFVHAWRMRKSLTNADIVWTHTESQYLAVAAVLMMTGARAKLLGQTVWLIDNW